MNSSKANYLPKDSPPIPLHSGFSTWILRGHNSPIFLAVQSLSLSDSGFRHPLSLRVCSNSCPLSQRCYLIISSCVARFSSCLQSSPASGSFPMSQLFTSGGQNTGASSSAAVLPMNNQDFTFTTSHIQKWVSFLVWLSHFILSGAVSPVAYWIPANLGAHLPVSCCFAFSYCSWGSRGKDIEAVHSTAVFLLSIFLFVNRP